ncbi:hypothetical protein HYALB_00007064 [Hymenoscyphus albidus]|uniref:Uncharacterized protein n=1 Tax=Hymenoscyphus albidus TaxID=595503 RepID=A0A9N9LIQ9_9HELO|nr:hypothetical protein HYALB_00007064 [Hymenoscyphus albidus]
MSLFCATMILENTDKAVTVPVPVPVPSGLDRDGDEDGDGDGLPHSSPDIAVATSVAVALFAREHNLIFRPPSCTILEPRAVRFRISRKVPATGTERVPERLDI